MGVICNPMTDFDFSYINTKPEFEIDILKYQRFPKFTDRRMKFVYIDNKPQEKGHYMKFMQKNSYH